MAWFMVAFAPLGRCYHCKVSPNLPDCIPGNISEWRKGQAGLSSGLPVKTLTPSISHHWCEEGDKTYLSTSVESCVTCKGILLSLFSDQCRALASHSSCTFPSLWGKLEMQRGGEKVLCIWTCSWKRKQKCSGNSTKYSVPWQDLKVNILLYSA